MVGFLGAGVVSAAANGYWVGVVLALVLSVFAKFSHDRFLAFNPC